MWRNIISLILINSFLFFDPALAGAVDLSCLNPTVMLSAPVHISQQGFAGAFETLYSYTTKPVLSEKVKSLKEKTQKVPARRVGKWVKNGMRSFLKAWVTWRLNGLYAKNAALEKRIMESGVTPQLFLKINKIKMDISETEGALYSFWDEKAWIKLIMTKNPEFSVLLSDSELKKKGKASRWYLKMLFEVSGALDKTFSVARKRHVSQVIVRKIKRLSSENLSVSCGDYAYWFCASIESSAGDAAVLDRKVNFIGELLRSISKYGENFYWKLPIAAENFLGEDLLPADVDKVFELNTRFNFRLYDEILREEQGYIRMLMREGNRWEVLEFFAYFLRNSVEALTEAYPVLTSKGLATGYRLSQRVAGRELFEAFEKTGYSADLFVGYLESLGGREKNNFLENVSVFTIHEKLSALKQEMINTRRQPDPDSDDLFLELKEVAPLFDPQYIAQAV